uniref:Secretion regulating guanine nucleotide exchange factor n=1 Tax=Myripristis murdjan TaxID=586833 RepID=A0A667ZX25_9TELE
MSLRLTAKVCVCCSVSDRVEGLGGVVSLACGENHCLAVWGLVFSWGLNSHGQLGLGKEVSLQPTPELVLSLTGVAVTQISAGGSHTLILTLPGLVYCCGANKAGQLGLNRVDEKGTDHLSSWRIQNKVTEGRFSLFLYLYCRK